MKDIVLFILWILATVVIMCFLIFPIVIAADEGWFKLPKKMFDESKSK